MIEVNSRRHSSAALLLRRLSTGDAHARRRATPDSHLVVRSPLRDPGSAYRNRMIRVFAPSIALQNQRSIHIRNKTPRPKSS